MVFERFPADCARLCCPWVVSRRQVAPACGATTSRSLFRATPLPSHPRSRGLYSVVKSSKTITHESLPLGRALPGVGPDDGSGVGVIPARAGATLSDLANLAQFAHLLRGIGQRER